MLEEIVEPLGFAEMIFPKLVPWEVWVKSGHAKGVYPEIYYVSVPKTRDPAYWEDVADHFKVTGEVPVDMIREKIDGPIGGLCYAQCPSFWPFLGRHSRTTACRPASSTARGPPTGTSPVASTGSSAWTSSIGSSSSGSGRPSRRSRRPTCFTSGTGASSTRCSSSSGAAPGSRPGSWPRRACSAARSASERIGTTDYEAYLPYSDSWLEFQNVSVNGDRNPRGFNVKVQSGGDLWSGCSGIGLERWTAAFLAQKGFDLDDWPADPPAVRRCT